MAENEHPASFDPVQADDSTVDRMCRLAYEALLQYKVGTPEPEPALAESVEVSPDGLVYTAKLRKGVKFHDGSELTAEDVKFSLDRAKKLGRGIAFVLQYYEETEVVDPYTLRIKLSRPYAPFMAALPKLYILNKKLVTANDKGDDGQAWLRDHEAGSGPYKLDSFAPEQEAVFSRFDGYWRGWDGEHVDKVVWRFVKESATQKMLLEKGDVDIAMDVSAEDLEALKSNPDISIHESPTLVEYFVFMATHRGPLKDKRVRQALSYAYDYAAHVNSVLRGHGTQSRGPIPAGMPYHDSSVFQYTKDLDKARQLLKEAGYHNGGFTLTMAYLPVLEEEVRTVEILQSACRELGIEIKPEGMTWPVLVDRLSKPETVPDLSTVYNFPSYADPDAAVFSFFHSSFIGNGLNFAYYKNPVADQLMEKGQTSVDPAAREQAYKELQRVLVEDAPAIYVSCPNHWLAARSYVKGYKYTPAHHETLNAYDIYLEGKK
ncbi:MAG: ABC transporter substrate-binding protein, partial [Bacillota bacterium]